VGGLLVDSLGWEWIFFVNVPVGFLAFVMAWRFVPSLPRHSHRFDLPGVLLSATGMFLLVFGIQQGETYNWGTIAGPLTVWTLIAGGLIVLALFVLWQASNRKEPLLPLKIFRDRNFSLANGGISTVGFAVTSMSLPLIFFYQSVLGLTPTQSALMLAPTAVISAGLAPVVGRLIDRFNPKYFATTGLLLMAGGLAWYAFLLTPQTAIWLLLLPAAVLGLANACIWGPLSTTATRNLKPALAGAGSGVYNTTRQSGAVLGSASIAALMQARLAAELPGAGSSGAPAEGGSAVLPDALHDGFAAAMGQSLLLPAVVAVAGALITVFFAKPQPVSGWDQEEAPAAEAADPASSPSPIAPPSSPEAGTGRAAKRH
jgi:MFS family permease